jgi:mono/diheme cytochrome c family protein
VRLLLTTLLSLIIVSCSGGRNSTGYSVINDMKYSLAAEAFATSKVFKNGQTMQNAPANTIARGWMPHPKDAAGNPVQFSENPFEFDEYAQYRGKMLYEVNCLPCHGAEGKGDGLVVKRGYPKPPSFSGRSWRKSNSNNSDYKNNQGWIYNLITFGRGNMGSYAQQLVPEDRWAVAEYVRRELGRSSKKLKKTLGY